MRSIGCGTVRTSNRREWIVALASGIVFFPAAAGRVEADARGRRS
jgi:hypothetical protein